MNKKYIMAVLICGATMFSSCSDFFEPEMNSELNEKDYIGQESEMYAGYIGIITKLQKVADKSIYLNDTRAEMLEPTENASNELVDIYSYKDDLTGNSIADPSDYYEVIKACNDFLARAYTFKQNNPEAIADDNYRALISSTIRMKAYTYLTIAKVYGEVLWYDDPLEGKVDQSKFERLDLRQTVKACLSLMDNGYDGVPSNLNISWKDWLDPNTDLAESQYRYWDYMTPPYFVLYAELSLWNGDYQKTVDLIQQEMNNTFSGSVKDNVNYMYNSAKRGKYAKFWDTKDPYPYECISAVLYDYTKGQTNNLLNTFDTESPNEYLLRPSTVGMERFTDDEFNPGWNNDTRDDATFKKVNGKYAVTKYRPSGSTVRVNAYEDDVPVYLYRGVELYFMLAEALNNLGRYEAAAALINTGINGVNLAQALVDDPEEWKGFTMDWTSDAKLGVRRYPDLGIRGSFGTALGKRTFLTKDSKKDNGDSYTPDEIKKANDKALLDEMMLEMSCEGRTLPAMIRVAQRWNDYTVISDRVAPKYSSLETIKAKIDAGKVFIHYDLNIK